MDAGDFTSVDLIKAYFARIDEVNLKGPQLRAVIETNPSALAQAAALDEERKTSGKRSELHGIPVLLKDNIATVTSEGSVYKIEDEARIEGSHKLGRHEHHCGVVQPSEIRCAR